MAHQGTINWTGASGKTYKYWIFPIGTTFEDKSGNYIFAKESSPGRWTSVYIGETQSLKDRLPNHEKLPCIRRNGGTHVHTHTSGGQQARLLRRQTSFASGHRRATTDRIFNAGEI